jgi:hypothetical protein
MLTYIHFQVQWSSTEATRSFLQFSPFVCLWYFSSLQNGLNWRKDWMASVLDLEGLSESLIRQLTNENREHTLVNKIGNYFQSGEWWGLGTWMRIKCIVAIVSLISFASILDENLTPQLWLCQIAISMWRRWKRTKAGTGRMRTMLRCMPR